MDAATLLDYYIHDMANIPEETQYTLKEMQKKDIEYEKVVSQMEALEGQLSKHIKQNGVTIRHPKEDAITLQMNKLYKRGEQIQEEKSLLLNTALYNISKNTYKFKKDVRRLVETGAIDSWDVSLDNNEDLELLDAGKSMSLLTNIDGPTSVKNLVSNSASRTNSAVTEVSRRLNSASLDSKRMKRRDKTPNVDESSNSREFTPSRRRDVTLGSVVKGPGRRVPSGTGNADSGGNGDDEDLYCFCQQVSYGEMVACDNPNCKFEWFHYDCVGLKEIPNGVWYCPDCRKDAKTTDKKKKSIK